MPEEGKTGSRGSGQWLLGAKVFSWSEDDVLKLLQPCDQKPLEYEFYFIV